MQSEVTEIKIFKFLVFVAHSKENYPINVVSDELDKAWFFVIKHTLDTYLIPQRIKYNGFDKAL